MDRGTILNGYAAYIRTGPGRSYPLIDPDNELNSLLRNNESFYIYEYSNGWFRHSRGGWSPETDNGLKIYDIEKNVSDGSGGSSNTNNTSTKITKPSTDSGLSEGESKYADYMYYDSKYDEQTSADLMIKNIRGVIGMPYQFLPSVDPRLTGSSYGRKFAEKIITKMPILFLSPGRPKFMKDFSNGDKKDVLKYLLTGDGGSIESLINGSGKFYSFESNYEDYYVGVNQMCRLAAKLLDIGDIKIPSQDGNTRLDKYNWETYSNDAFQSFFCAGPDTLGFYIDSEKQISETFSNDTTQSMLAEKVNSLSELGREMQFLLGGTAGVEFEKFKQTSYDATLNEFNSFANKYLSILPETLISRLTSGFMTVSVGGKMLFPEIWSDSTFTKNFTINAKLRSPDADDLSIYLNILVPLFHYIQFTGPQQLGNNSYSSPFLLRGHYKSFFTVDMGLVSSLNITKGDNCKWSARGLPTEVDISMDIKDLYPVMVMLQNEDNMIYNTSLIDYISNLCGININRPSVLRMADIYISKFLTDHSISERVSRTLLSLEESLNNSLTGIYEKIFR